jgi:putative oxidoreductase
MKTDLALLVLRIYAGFFMIFLHGWPKLSRYAELSAGGFADPIGVGPLFSLWLTLFAEVFCAVFVLLGIVTRWASIPLAITMAVAAFIVHAPDPWSRKELAISYLCVYVALALLGGGRFGFDSLIKRLRD